MELRDILEDNKSLITGTTPENIIKKGVARFKERMIFSIVFTLITLGVVLTIAIYLYFIITRSIK